MITTANGVELAPVDVALEHARGAIYAVVHRETRRVYVGMTKDTVASRWRQHCYDMTRHKRKYYFATALRRHGAEAFDVYVIEHGLTPKDLLTREAHYVKLFFGDRKPFGFNSTAGGDVSPASNQDVRAKISASGRGKIISAVARAKISAALTGRERSAEHRANIGKAHRGKLVSAVARARSSESHKGNKPNDETRARMSASQRARFDNNEDARARHSAMLRARWADPEYKARVSQSLGKAFSKPEVKAKLRAAIARQTPETRAKLSAAANRRWDGYRAKQNATAD